MATPPASIEMLALPLQVRNFSGNHFRQAEMFRIVPFLQSVAIFQLRNGIFVRKRWLN
jgi:hypothetical protein